MRPVRQVLASRVIEESGSGGVVVVAAGWAEPWATALVRRATVGVADSEAGCPGCTREPPMVALMLRWSNDCANACPVRAQARMDREVSKTKLQVREGDGLQWRVH